MIDLNKVTHTRNGGKVLYAKHFPDNYPENRIVAVITNSDNQVEAMEYYENGRLCKDKEYGIDLMEEKTTVTRWFNVYKDDDGFVLGNREGHHSESKAIEMAKGSIGYLKTISIEVDV